jgi:hypothetical protein
MAGGDRGVRERDDVYTEATAALHRFALIVSAVLAVLPPQHLIRVRLFFQPLCLSMP